MQDLSAKTLSLLIQAVDAEIQRLRHLPNEGIVSEDEERLADFETVAEELEDHYEALRASGARLPAYSSLLRAASPSPGA